MKEEQKAYRLVWDKGEISSENDSKISCNQLSRLLFSLVKGIKAEKHSVNKEFRRY
jgi:hypothetical protein